MLGVNVQPIGTNYNRLGVCILLQHLHFQIPNILCLFFILFVNLKHFFVQFFIEGKRLSSPTTTYPKISIETRNWNNLKGAWGRKRMAATAAANNWNQLHGMWGKRRRRTPTWNKMSSAWGKSMYN